MINLVIVYRQLLIFKLICWLLIFFLMENFSMRYHIGLGHPLLKGCVGKCPFGPGYCNRNYQIIKKKKNYLPSNPSLSCKTPL